MILTNSSFKNYFNNRLIMQKKGKMELIIKKICQQKMLPTLINSISSNEVKHNTFLEFKRAIHNNYKQCLRVPQIYEPGQQKSDRQKLIQKISKIKKNEIPIEYLQMKKDKNGKNYPTYRGHKLQQICVETKEQFKIFKEFNQENFNKNVLDNIFEDKLQHSEKQQIYNPYIYNQKNQLKKRLNTIDHYQSPKSIKQRLYTEKAETIKNDKRINTRGTSNDSIKFPNIIMTFRNEKSKNKKNYLNLQKLSIKKIISGEQMAEIRTIFNRIGGYQKVKAQSIITKQSIVKYLKRFYEKPYRIIDFLEIKPVITFEQYAHISKKIKVMQMQHFMFLTFLFYDTNNDGIICEGDLMRLQNLSKIYTFLNEDYKKLIMAKFQQKTTKIPDYYELYGLSQITQSIYFNWNKSYKNSKQEQNIVNTEQSIQIDTKILNLKRKKFSIDFYKFKKIFQHAKPLLWYELMFRLNGTRYQGLIYKQ